MCTILDNGHEYRYLNEEELEEQRDLYLVMSNGGMKIYPERILIPSLYANVADELYKYMFRKTDVLVIGYPKTGTSWSQEVVWTMLNNPNLDNPIGQQELLIRSPVFEFEAYATLDNVKGDPKYYERMKEAYPEICLKEDLNWFEVMEAVPDSRVFKSHMPPTLLNPLLIDTAKVVFVVRDPRDVCLSFYYFSKNFNFFGFRGTLEKFVDAFMNEKLLMGDMCNFIRQWLPYKNHKNFHLLFYEDLKRNTAAELNKLNDFLNTKLTKAQLEKIKHHISFEQMKKQDSYFNQPDESNFYVKDESTKDIGGFYRKGVVGEHKEAFTPELHQKFKNYLEKNFKEMADRYF